MARSVLAELLDGSKQLNASRARAVAAQLRDHGSFKSHGRYITRERAQAIGLEILPLEVDQQFQDLVLSVFHATTHTLAATACVKIIENHIGKAFVKLQQAIQVPVQVPQGQQQPPAPAPEQNP